MPHFFAKAFFVDGTYLFKEYDGILLKPEFICVNINVRRHFIFIGSGGNGGGNNSGTVAVTHVVLHNKYGTYSALLRADNG